MRPNTPRDKLWITRESFNLTRENAARWAQADMRGHNVDDTMLERLGEDKSNKKGLMMGVPNAIPELLSMTMTGKQRPNPARDFANSTNLLHSRRWRGYVKGPAEEGGKECQPVVPDSNPYSDARGWGGDWMTPEMTDMQEVHKQLASDQRYFERKWDRNALRAIYDSIETRYKEAQVDPQRFFVGGQKNREEPAAAGCPKNGPATTQMPTGPDAIMAKFLIRMHLSALEIISKKTTGTDKRMKMLNCFDLASLEANVEYLWKYTRLVRLSKLARVQGATNDYMVMSNQEDDQGTVGKMFLQDNKLRDIDAYMQASGHPGGPQDQLRQDLQDPNPPMMPAIACGPPRMGKSALIALYSSFVVKLGGTVMLGVGPNKIIPFQEMVAKYTEKLQWTPTSQEEDEHQTAFAARAAKRAAEREAERRAAVAQAQAPPPPPPRPADCQGCDAGGGPDLPPDPCLEAEKDLSEKSMGSVDTPPNQGNADVDMTLPAAGSGPVRMVEYPRWDVVYAPTDDPPTVQLNGFSWRGGQMRVLNYEAKRADTGVDMDKPLRTTQQGLEIATMWGRATVQTQTKTQTIDVWKRSYANGSTLFKDNGLDRPSKWGAWYSSQLANQPTIPLLQRALAGVHHEHMQLDKPVQIYMYSETEENDVKAASDVVDAIHEISDPDSFCVSIHDECQSAFAKSTEDPTVPKLDPTTGQQARNQGKLLFRTVAEGERNWQKPKPVLYQHRRAYAVLRNLKLLVSATVLPATMESKLFGRVFLRDWGERQAAAPAAAAPAPAPAGGQGSSIQAYPRGIAAAEQHKEWEVWHKKLDAQLVEDVKEAATQKLKISARMCPMLLPPRGRLFYGGPNVKDKDRLPPFVTCENPVNGNIGGAASYYGTMAHFKPWDPGMLGRDYDADKLMEEWMRPFRLKWINVFDPAEWWQEGSTCYTTDGQWDMDLSHNPSMYRGAAPTAKEQIMTAQTEYGLKRQFVASLVPSKGVELSDGTKRHISTAPYRRPMSIVVDYPSSEFVKTMMMVKDWLDDGPYDEFNKRTECSEHIVRTFFPMFVMCPTRTQQNDEGVIDWSVQAIKYAWYRMHKDFTINTRLSSANRVTENRTLASIRIRKTDGSDEDVALPDQTAPAQSNTKNFEHPYHRCKTLRQFRARYGMVVLVYGATFDDTQRKRVMVEPAAPRTKSGRGTTPSPGPSAGSGSGRGTPAALDESTDDRSTADDRIISLLFDPAHPQNRMASYGDAPSGWMVLDDDYARVNEVTERSPLDTFVDVVGVFDLTNSGSLSYKLRELLPVSPEGMELTLQPASEASRVLGATMTIKIALKVPVTEYEEIIATLEDRFGTVAAFRNSGVFDSSPVLAVRPERHSWNRNAPERQEENPSNRPERLKPFEIKLSDIGSWIDVGPHVARGNMVPDAEAKRVRGMVETTAEGTIRANVEVAPGYQRYFFASELTPEFQPRLSYMSDLQGPEQPVKTPLEDLNGIVPKLQWQSWPDAQTAIAHFEKHYGITRIMASGYMMFQAGTTLQAGISNNCRYAAHHPNMYETYKDQKERVNHWGPTDLNWIPKYMALASSSEASIDVLYQMLGRCFVDLGADARNQPIQLPEDPATGEPWKVSLLGARTLIPAVDLYAKLELRFSQLEGMTLTEAVAHLAQFAKSHHPNPTSTLQLKDMPKERKQHVGGALPLMFMYRLGVEGRLHGVHEFFKLMEKPPPYYMDHKLLTPIPPRDPNPDTSATSSMAIA